MKKLTERDLRKIRGGFTPLDIPFTNFLGFMNTARSQKIAKHHTFFKWLFGKK